MNTIILLFYQPGKETANKAKQGNENSKQGKENRQRKQAKKKYSCVAIIIYSCVEIIISLVLLSYNVLFTLLLLS